MDVLYEEPLPLIVALWARLAEIGVRVTFVAMTFVASLIFDEIGEEIVNLTDISIDPKAKALLSINCGRLISHNDLAIRLIEQINKNFGFVLLIISAIDFSSAIFYFNQIKSQVAVRIERSLFAFEMDAYYTDKDVKFHKTSSLDFYEAIFSCAQFLHSVARFTGLLIASHRVNAKVEYK